MKDVVGNEETVSRLAVMLKTATCPTYHRWAARYGKTTSILALARQMLGSAFSDAVLELNASDQRYDVVRSKI